MAIYQFLIATQGFAKSGIPGVSELRDSDGNLTGHLVGLFHRTVQFMEQGVKPIWVFDGKAPDLKADELEKRAALKEKAEEEKKEAEAAGDMERAKQLAGRSIRITKEMMADAKKLVKLLGVPMIEAPSEAEAQCAEMVKMGLAFGTGTEDMDALTFGSKYLLRGFNSKKEDITQIHLDEVLEGFGMNMDEFIDLCIMCGCDYTHTIGGIGPVKAFKLIEEHKNIEKCLEVIREQNADPNKKQKFIMPESFLYAESRQIFKEPEVIRDKEELEAQLKWSKPDSEALKAFLVEEKAFAENKVSSGLTKLQNCQGKVNQSRLDLFFKSAGVQSSTQSKVKGAKGGKAAAAGAKRGQSAGRGRGRK